MDAEVSARIFHFGVVSLRVRVTAPTEMTWEEFTAFGNAVQAADSAALFSAHLQALAARIQSATERPFLAPLTRTNIMFRVNGLRVPGCDLSAVDALRHADRAALLERVASAVARSARRDAAASVLVVTTTTSPFSRGRTRSSSIRRARKRPTSSTSSSSRTRSCSSCGITMRCSTPSSPAFTTV